MCDNYPSISHVLVCILRHGSCASIPKCLLILRFHKSLFLPYPSPYQGIHSIILLGTSFACILVYILRLLACGQGHMEDPKHQHICCIYPPKPFDGFNPCQRHNLRAYSVTRRNGFTRETGLYGILCHSVLVYILRLTEQSISVRFSETKGKDSEYVYQDHVLTSPFLSQHTG